MGWRRLAFIIIAGAQCSMAHAQSVTGEIGLYDKYLDDDLFVYTDEPVVQAGLYVNATDQCSLDAWGSHGLATDVGGELDLGASCRFAISDETEIEIEIARVLLRGSSDLTSTTARISHGSIDFMVEHYLWDNNPDATRFVAGYSLYADERTSVRPYVIYETGFGESDILVGGVSAEYALTGPLTLVGTVLAPIAKSENDTRSPQLSVGIRFAF